MDRYDRAITIFSPDGHLFQVEYAQEAVKKGSTAIGLKGKDCIVICVEKKTVPELQDTRSLRKVYLLDSHVVMTFAGLNADARLLANRARVQAQSYQLDYGDPVTVNYMAKYIANRQQVFTQSNGRRPFGVAAIIAGFNYDHTAQVCLSEPSGTMYEWNACAIGRNCDPVKEYLEKQYNEEAVSTVDGAVKLAVKALSEVVQSGAQNIEVAIMTKKPGHPSEGLDVDFKFLPVNEIEALLKVIEAEKQKEAEQRKPTTSS